jgi:hypothetical protein
MNELQIKQHIAQMLKEGFTLAPCANEACENLFASDVYCVACEEDN